MDSMLIVFRKIANKNAVTYMDIAQIAHLNATINMGLMVVLLQEWSLVFL